MVRQATMTGFDCCLHSHLRMASSVLNLTIKSIIKRKRTSLSFLSLCIVRTWNMGHGCENSSKSIIKRKRTSLSSLSIDWVIFCMSRCISLSMCIVRTWNMGHGCENSSKSIIKRKQTSLSLHILYRMGDILNRMGDILYRGC